MSTSCLPAFILGDQLLMDGIPPTGPEGDDYVFGYNCRDVETVDVPLDSYAGLTAELMQSIVEALGIACDSTGDAVQSASTPLFAPFPVVLSPTSQSPPQTHTVPTDAAAPASSEHGPAPSRKRKAQRAAGPRANKRAALEDNMKSIPNIPGITDAHLPPVPGFDHIALRFHGQLRLGCTPVSGEKMQCCDCSRSAAYADMWRHLECRHGYGEVPCEGCPQTFSRGDSLLRHTRARGKSHFSAARKSAVPKFNALQEVIKLRAERPRGEKSTSKEKLDFNKMINAKFTTWLATGVFV
ncbi:hypothetical protein DFH06DRAFT_1121260 [Mycena polygramma]|nr:hypothetical protein DFH06DRAFT_1121260 [Mycena polygramma]